LLVSPWGWFCVGVWCGGCGVWGWGGGGVMVGGVLEKLQSFC